MLKRIKFPGWILIIVLLIVFVNGINQLVSAANKGKKQEEEIREEKVIGKYPKIQLKTVVKQTDEYTYSVNVPETDSEQINHSIHKWLNRQKEQFLKEVENKQGKKRKNRQAHLNIQMETHQVTEDFYCLVFRTYEVSDGANGLSAVKVFNIDIRQERFLKINDVLDLDGENVERIEQIVWEELQNNEKIKPYLFEEEFHEFMKTPTDWEWSIDREKFTLYVDEYEIAAGAAGEIEVDIPIEKMYIFLQDAVDSYLKMPKEQQQKKEIIIQQEKMKLDPNGKYIALTFDDGPNPKTTPRILETLKEHDAKATFFMLGNQVDYYPDLAREVAEEGHEIGNHSKSHPLFTKMSFAKIKEQLDFTKAKIKEATGITPHLLRPPYGAFNEQVLKYARENGDSIILWSVDSLDWKNRNAVSVNKIVQNNVNPNGIVLMHDIHPTTADALPQLLTALEQEGYQFVTVSQLLNLKNENGEGPYFAGRAD